MSMNQKDSDLRVIKSGAGQVCEIRGAWDVRSIELFDRSLAELRKEGRLIFDCSGLRSLDSAGAWLLVRTERAHRAAGGDVDWKALPEKFNPLIDRVREGAPKVSLPLPPLRRPKDWVIEIGRSLSLLIENALALISFFGEFIEIFLRSLFAVSHWRPKALVSHLEQAGLNAIPIVSLISFLVGVVLAYQGADQLRAFGAEIFTINLVGISVLREMGILLTAIVVAGRSGSAFTAQIGTMQVNEEIDAMRTLGLNPMEVLVIPRVIALMIALVLLTFVADMAGLLGGGLMIVSIVDIDFRQYLSFLKAAVAAKHFWVGIVKAPVFAMLIAIVGCFEGLRVEGSAESVGRLTTRSVVEGIFLVIVFDAFFSILFSLLKI